MFIGPSANQENYVYLYNSSHVINQRLTLQLELHETNRLRRAAAGVRSPEIEHQRADQITSFDYRKERKILEK